MARFKAWGISWLLLLFALPMTSCTAITSMIDEGKALVKEGKELVAEAKVQLQKLDVPLSKVQSTVDAVTAGAALLGEKGAAIAAKASEFGAVFAKADINKDGRVSGMSEWWQVLLGFIGVLGGGTGLAALFKSSSAQALAGEATTTAVAAKTQAVTNTTKLEEHKEQLDELYDVQKATDVRIALATPPPPAVTVVPVPAPK